MKAVDSKWVRLRAFEVEAALDAAWMGGYACRQAAEATAVMEPMPVAAWDEQARAESAEVFQKRQYMDEEGARRKVAFEANVKVLSAIGQTIQANAQAVEAVSRLVDNMGRLA